MSQESISLPKIKESAASALLTKDKTIKRKRIKLKKF